MDIALVVIGVVIIGYLQTISTRQRSAEGVPKRSMVVNTMLKYTAANGPEYGPFYCRKVIELDYIPQVGMQMNLDGVDRPQQVAMVTDDQGFTLTLTKHRVLDFSSISSGSLTEDEFVSYLKENGWEVETYQEDDWDFWPEYKSWSSSAS